MEGLMKRYLCLLDEEEEAARSYDKHAMVLHGLQVGSAISPLGEDELQLLEAGNLRPF